MILVHLIFNMITSATVGWIASGIASENITPETIGDSYGAFALLLVSFWFYILFTVGILLDRTKELKKR